MDLFENTSQHKEESFTLADRMRPRTLDEILGQESIIAKGKPLRIAIESKKIGSMVFWGPPGCGKTTLARVIASETGMRFLAYSAVLSGINEIKEVIKSAERRLSSSGERSILFVDEVHRFNKAQQDAFLPFVEHGTIIFIGATTENPSFEVISPLLSRVSVFVMNPLEPKDIVALLKRAILDKERGLGALNIEIEDSVLERIAGLSSGDARFALTVLEFSANTAKNGKITEKIVADVLQREPRWVDDQILRLWFGNGRIAMVFLFSGSRYDTQRDTGCDLRRGFDRSRGLLSRAHNDNAERDDMARNRSTG